MRKIVPVCLVLLFSAFIASCGELRKKYGRLEEEEGVTNVEFALDRPHSLVATLNGGMMIYAVRVDNPLRRASKYFANDSSLTSWVLPNGQYNFYAIGYASAGMGNPFYCGASAQINLGGASTTVPIVLDDQTKCGTSPFSITGTADNTTDYPENLYFGHCDSSNPISGVGANLCDGISGRPAGITTSSIRVSLIEYSALIDGNVNASTATTVIDSGCINGTFSGATAPDTGLRIPYGAPFALKIETYSSVSCGGTFLGASYLLRGMQNAEDHTVNTYKNTSGAFVSPGVQQGKFYTGSTSANYFFMRQIP